MLFCTLNLRMRSFTLHTQTTHISTLLIQFSLPNFAHYSSALPTSFDRKFLQFLALFCIEYTLCFGKLLFHICKLLLPPINSSILFLQFIVNIRKPRILGSKRYNLSCCIIRMRKEQNR